MTAPAFVFYGDDFTGATDTLATLVRAGHRALLFTGVPTAQQLSQAGPLDAIGIAGAARSMAPDAMRAELEPVARFFSASGARVLHYKVCSTFDSAPQIGNIATAIATLRGAAPNPLVAIVGGQPGLGRHCLFGHLFAASGTGGEVHRIDRHPTMSRHPVTPMHEADLRRHLAAQGLRSIALLPWTAPADALGTVLDEVLAGRPEAVLFDVADDAHLARLGTLLRAHAERAPLLAVGASSVAQALMPGRAVSAAEPVMSAAAGPVLVLAGSLSPATAEQVRSARSYHRVELDAAALARGDAAHEESVARHVVDALRDGRHTLAHTSAPDAASRSLPAGALAAACGRLLNSVLRACPLRRIGVAGGDTSSHALKALDVWGLSYRGTLAPGVALCRASSGLAHLDGVEMMLKGGQMGGPDLFELLIDPAA